MASLVVKNPKNMTHGGWSFHELIMMIVQQVRYPGREAMNDVTSADCTLHHINPLHYMHGCPAPIQRADLRVLVVTTSRTLPYRVM